MADETEEWRPGSFTKNFSWGPRENGLRELYDSIRIGFAETLEDVPRAVFRERVADEGRPDYIPINFFLFNRPQDGEDMLIVDELVFQALTATHSERFDRLALFAFLWSLVGKWRGSERTQRRPALWAKAYVREQVDSRYGWSTKRVNAKDIERFVGVDPRYKAKSAGKLSTNLAYMFDIGGLSEFASERIDRWWVDALFLGLDRVLEDRRLDGKEIAERSYGRQLRSNGFLELTGGKSLDKDIALEHLVRLYISCGGRDRFEEEDVLDRTRLLLPDIDRFLANDERPRGAVDPTNPRVLKSIPRACAMLAKYVAGFEVIDPEAMESFDIDEFVRTRTRAALRRLQQDGIEPNMTAEELMRITREK